MRILPSGTRGLLLELDSLEEVLGRYAALRADPPPGVVDLVPAGRTILVSTEPGVSLSDLAGALRRIEPHPELGPQGEQVQIPVHYDGADLTQVAEHLGCSPEQLVQRHTSEEWVVAFCGFSPGFGYLSGTRHTWDIPRRADPRTKVPPGAVGLAGEFAGIYPRESPGGWQLLGHTELTVFDLTREPAALLRPGVRVRFVEAS